MTRSGSSAEISSTKSAVPRSHTASMMPSAYPTICCSRSRTSFGVKPLLTRRRYRVCMVGSMFSIIMLLLGQLIVVHVGEEGRVLVRGEALPVPVHGDAVVVVGDGPEATPGGRRLGVPVDRGFGPEPAEPLVGDAGHEVAPVDEVDLLETHGPPFSLQPARPAGGMGGWQPPQGQFLERVSVIMIIGTAAR